MPKRKQIEDGIGFVLKSQRTSASATKRVHCEIPNLLEKIERSVWSAILSPKFEVAGIEFSLLVWPMPITGNIAVYLCNESGKKVCASFSIQSAGKMLSFEKKDYPAHFLKGSLLSYSNYRKWVEKNGDIFKLKATITVHLEQEPKEVNLSLGKMIMKDDATTDLTIVCMTKSFRVHKAILCARSPVWRAIIMDKRRRGEQIEVPDVDEVTLGSIITYMYTGELPDTHDFDVEKMIFAANKGRIQSNISYVFSFFKAKRNRILN